ncbi:MAG TPA: T9SS type A sorting domain-containing protein [Candidatus Cloacimonadota bacterium]|nr:T9SS type A sorting domain-containing protein [Candidatus Cloacimonadota bacterium]
MRVRILLFLFVVCSVLFAQVPAYEFTTEPTDLLSNYYDYMPGSYYGTPVQVEEDGSVYLVFHARETENSTRRIYYAYLDADGNLLDLSTVGTEDVHEGYPALDLDPETGTPLAAWQGYYATTAPDAEIVGSYDQFPMITPGSWVTPFVIFDDSIPSPNGILDEFLWPEVHIGPSPDPDKRRIYVVARNNYSSGNPSENIVIGYTDFDENDLSGQFNVEWTYNTIPLMNQWNLGNPWGRGYVSSAISDDGKIALIGHACFENGSDSLIVFWNDNFGMGDYQYFSQSAYYPVEFQNQTCYFAPVFSGHFSAVFDGSDQIEMQLCYCLEYDDGTGNYCLYPDQFFPYIFRYDLTNNEFHFIIANYEINENAANPSYEWGYDQMYLPWDTDNDGEIDEINAAGEVVMMQGWPIYYWDYDNAFHDNLSKIAINQENGWIAHVWQDGLKAKLAAQGVAGYENWQCTPEIAICISSDNGATWRKPLFLNALETPELAGMIPEYVYPGDKIKDLGDNWGELQLMFLDDNSYGSYVMSQGSNLGGTQMFASLRINFDPLMNDDHNTIVTEKNILSNYPNPFNPTTTIKFNVQANSKISIEVFNVKGQKVKQLVNERMSAGERSIVWNGTDDNNRSVASGIYFYKMKADGRYTETRKMILLK